MTTKIFTKNGWLLLLLSFIFMTITIGCSSDDEKIKPVNNEIVKSTHLEAVDLGLSVYWANCNIGAMAPSEFGGHYCWGDPTGLERSYSIEDMPSSICGTQNDIVSANFGHGWRLPTITEINELISKCKSSKTTINGTTGYKFTGPSGLAIFLPGAGYMYGSSDIIFGDNTHGYYWAGDGTPSKRFAYYLYFGGEKLPAYGNISYNVSVRAVKEKNDSSITPGEKDDEDKDNGNQDSSEYEKPDISYYDCTSYPTALTVKYKIYNNNKAQVEKASIIYRTSGKVSAMVVDVSGTYITGRLTDLKRGTTYYVKCTAKGKGGSFTTEETKLMTLN